MKPFTRVIINGAMFLLFALIIYFGVNPKLVFHFQQLGFLWDSYFMNSFLKYPGGLVEYFSIFVFQFAKMRFLGALIYSMLAVGLVYFSHKVLSNQKSTSNIIMRFLPVVVLATLVVSYGFPMYFIISLLVMLILLVLYKRFSQLFKGYYSEIIPALIFVPLAYYLLGGAMFMIFSVSLLLIELFQSFKVKWLGLLLIVFLMFVIPLFSAHYLFFITIENAYLNLGPTLSINNSINIILLFLISVPIGIIFQWIINKFGFSIRKKSLFHALQYGFVSLAFVFVFFISRNSDEKNKVEVDYLAFHGQWEKVLELVDKNPSTDRLINFHTNRALFHTGQMPHRLFEYSQQWGVDGLFMIRHFMNEILLPSTQLFIELSYMNEAIHWANEAISQKEYSPQIIEQLIIAHIIDQNYSFAQHYVDYLKKFPFFKKTALEYELMIKNNKPSKQMLELRKFIPYENFIVSRMSPDKDLYYLLEDHGDNKMVYEYLMSYYLLNSDLDSFVKTFNLGSRFNYQGIPKLYQQALTYYMYELNLEGKPVPQIKIDDEILADFSDYISILIEFEGNTKYAQSLLTKHSNTFWYYHNFVSPVTLNRKIVVE